MNELFYTIEQVYKDNNIIIKPYPFCPKCFKKINIQVTNTYNIKPVYEIKCDCKNFIWIYNKDINKLCEQWNKYCIDYINENFINIIDNNIILSEIGVISSFLLFIYFINLPQLLPLIGFIIYIPMLLKLILDNKWCKCLINKYIINKSIINQLTEFNIVNNQLTENNIANNQLTEYNKINLIKENNFSTVEGNLNKENINIQEEVNKLFNFKRIIDNFRFYYSISEINDIISINQQIYQYYINHYKDIDNEYLNQLNKFNDMLLIINKEKIKKEDIKNNDNIKKLIHLFQLYFNKKLNEINELKINNINNQLLNI